MSERDEPRRDARRCPECGAIGILPLDQPKGAEGHIDNPVMICPHGHPDFRAGGMTWLGAFDVADMTDEDVDQLAEQLVKWQDQISAQDRRHASTEPLPDRRPDTVSLGHGANWTSLLYDVEARLTELVSHGGGYLVLNVDTSDDPFVQRSDYMPPGPCWRSRVLTPTTARRR